MAGVGRVHNGAKAGLFATNRRRGGAPAFTPSDITNVLDWVDANDIAKITAASNLVSAVAGQLGVLTWSQATGAQKPTSGLNTINAKNVIDFGTAAKANGDTWLDSGATSFSTAGSHQWAILQVTAFDGGSGLTIFMDGTAATRAAFYSDPNGSGDFLSLFAGGTYPNKTNQALNTSLHLVVANFVGGTTNSVIYFDGAAKTLPSDVGSGTALGSRIGQDANHSAGSSGNRLSGHMCAWGIGTSIMGSTDRASLLAWAQANWGTP